MGIHKILTPVEKDVLSHNQRYFEKFGHEACQQNKKVLLAISEGRNGEILLTAAENLSPKDLWLRLNHVAEILKTQIDKIN